MTIGNWRIADWSAAVLLLSSSLLSSSRPRRASALAYARPGYEPSWRAGYAAGSDSSSERNQLFCRALGARKSMLQV